MGHFFQVQDDFLDCFGNQELPGKSVSTDIRECKCSWLVVVALQRATPAQRKLLEENYGRSELEAVNAVRTHIQQISKGLSHNLFYKFLERIYRRDS